MSLTSKGLALPSHMFPGSAFSPTIHNDYFKCSPRSKPPATLLPPAPSHVAPFVPASDLDSYITVKQKLSNRNSPSSWYPNMKNSFCLYLFFFPCRSIDEVAHLPAKTNLPVYALRLIAFHLLGKLPLLMIPSFSCIFDISPRPAIGI